MLVSKFIYRVILIIAFLLIAMIIYRVFKKIRTKNGRSWDRWDKMNDLGYCVTNCLLFVIFLFSVWLLPFTSTVWIIKSPTVFYEKCIIGSYKGNFNFCCHYVDNQSNEPIIYISKSYSTKGYDKALPESEYKIIQSGQYSEIPYKIEKPFEPISTSIIIRTRGVGHRSRVKGYILSTSQYEQYRNRIIY